MYVWLVLLAPRQLDDSILDSFGETLEALACAKANLMHICCDRGRELSSLQATEWYCRCCSSSCDRFAVEKLGTGAHQESVSPPVSFIDACHLWGIYFSFQQVSQDPPPIGT